MAAKSDKKSRKRKLRDLHEIDCFKCAQIAFYLSVGQLKQQEAERLWIKHMHQAEMAFEEKHRIFDA